MNKPSTTWTLLDLAGIATHPRPGLARAEPVSKSGMVGSSPELMPDRLCTISLMLKQPTDLVRTLSKGLHGAFETIDAALVAHGATAEHDVKTIYISYMVEGQMVAAVYPRSQEIEIALALPEDHPSSLLRDATHLTWRTLPVSTVVVSTPEAQAALGLVQEAVERVASGVHDVHRDNDHFIARRRERRVQP